MNYRSGVEKRLFALKWFDPLRHMAEVLRIEEASFPQCWEAKDFRMATRGSGTAKVALMQGRVVGYVVWDTGKRGMRVTNLAVHHAYRRLGFARFMLRHLQNKLRATTDNYRWLTAMCNEHNDRAIALFRSIGMRAIGVEPQPYGGTSDDGYVFQWEREPQPDHKATECCGK